jgi:signal peptidase I
LRVSGTSMVPSILPGDLVLIKKASLPDISAGEIVVYLRKGRFVVHRVVDRNAAGTAARPEVPRLITRGDRLRQDDAPVSEQELLGRVVSIERENRKVALPATGTNRAMVRLLRASDRVTCLYLKLAACRRNLFIGRAKCRA